MMRSLRIAALAVLAVSVAVALWLASGAPWIEQDSYYAAVRAQQGLPFVAIAAAIGLLVFFAGGTKRSRSKWASAGLWLALMGATLVTGSIVGELLGPSGHFLRYSEYGDSYLLWVRSLSLVMSAGALSLLAGGALWLLSYRLDRRRAD